MSEAVRTRLSVLGLVAIVGLLAIREWTGPQSLAVPPESVSGGGSVPAESVSIGTFVAAGREVRVGEVAADAVRMLDSVASPRRVSDDLGTIGRRQIRSYDVANSRVTVVLEPFETQGPLRVAAIYLH